MSNDTQTSKMGAALTQILKSEAPGNRLREGDVTEVILLRKDPRAAYFDLGKFGTGIVFGAELGNAREMLKKLETGNKVPAKIIDLDGEDGYVEISLAEAGKQRLWQQAQELMDAGEIVPMTITGANAGGLMGNLIDLKAFLPISQLTNEHQPKSAGEDRQKSIEEMKAYVGQEFSVKIININPRNNKLIVSEREVLSANVKELLEKYEVGQVVDAIVSGLADFGIFVRFVDNPEIEGLVHISEIDHRLIDNPKEIMKLNEGLKVKIIDIREGRVFLSLKALKPNPWDGAEGRFKSGETVKGTLYKFNPFGAVIDFPDGVQGMIHVSEFGGTDEMKAKLVPEKEHEFVVDTVKPEEKRLILKLKK